MAVPSPYGRDPFSQLNRLLEAPHSASGSIRKACLAVEECLASNRDNLRGFFDKPFANLLKRVFGYGDFEASWLNIVTKGRDADARALVDLLAPNGKLFAAMAQADNDRLVQYIFPTERLPAHTQELLKDPQGLGRRVLDTWPQYRGRIRHDAAGRPQVYLNLFEYFMFWTAFYVLRGSSSDSARTDPRTPTGHTASSVYGGFRSVGSAIVGNLMQGRAAGPLQSHPYYLLLKTYLDYFLPRSVGGGAADRTSAVSGAAAGASSSIGSGLSGLSYGMGLGADGAAAASTASWASYKPTLTAAAAGPDSRGAVLLSILVEFLLTDVAEPLPSLAADRVSGVVQPGSAGPAAAPGLMVGGGMAGVTSPVGAGLMGVSSPPTPVSVATPPSVRMLTYQPPSEELVEGLVTLVRYVHVVEPDARADGVSAAGGGAAAAGSRGVSVGFRSSGGGASSAGRGSVGGGGGGRPLQPAQVGRPPWLPETPIKTPPLPRPVLPPTPLAAAGNSGSGAVQAVSRKVYRQLRRAFSQWPPSSPTSLTPLISLWLSVIAPWCPLFAHTRKTAIADVSGGHGASGAATSHPANGASGGAGGGGANGIGSGSLGSGHHHHHPHLNLQHALDAAGPLGTAAAAAAGVMEATAAKLHFGSGGGRERDLTGATSRELLSQYTYTPAWRSHVLAHLPFYLQLIPQFVSLSLSRLKYRPDVALRDLDRVLAVLAAAGPELLRELRVAEVSYNAFARPAAAGGRRRSEGEMGELAPWWLEQVQDFEAAAASGSSSPGAVQPDVAGRLFTTDSSGAAYMTCLLLRSAETLGQPELVAALRQSASAVLPLEAILPAAVAEQPRQQEGAFGAAGASRFPRAGRWSSLWPSLVQQDPRLADPRRLWLHVYRSGGGPGGRQHDPLLRPIASNEVSFLVRPLVRASARVNAALGLDVPYRPGEEEEEPPEHLGQLALLWARKRGYRVNLRIFAEIQTLVWLLLLVLLGYGMMRVLAATGGAATGAGGAAAGTAAAGAGVAAGAGGGGQPQQPGLHVGRQQHQQQRQYQPRYGAGGAGGPVGQYQQRGGVGVQQNQPPREEHLHHYLQNQQQQLAAQQAAQQQAHRQQQLRAQQQHQDYLHQHIPHPQHHYQQQQQQQLQHEQQANVDWGLEDRVVHEGEHGYHFHDPAL